MPLAPSAAKDAPSGRPTADGAFRFGRAVTGLWRATLLGAALLASGCVERTLLITSDPLGARVTLNGKSVGVTPVTVPFVHNQRFEYRLEKSGYRLVAGDVKTPSTWDSVPGLDFVAENAYPGRIRRRTVHAVKLERLAAAPSRADLEAKFRQADAFRVRAESETGGPDVPAPSRPDRLPPPTPAPAQAPTSATAAPQAGPPASR